MMTMLSETMKNKINNLWRVAVLFIVIFPQFAFAFGGDIPPLTNALNNLASFLDSSFVKVVGVLAVIGVGYSTLHLGKMNKEQAIWTIVGIGLIVGAGQVMNLLGFGG